jgi:NADH-quinone oxidoreductase subunit H
MNVYSVVIAGWASNSKYSLLGSIRAVAQMISYELVLGAVILMILAVTGTLNFFDIVYYQHISVWLCFPLIPIIGVTYVVMLAETNRVPFDLPEAESELVAGYNVEYSSITFAMFFLGEYCSMIAMSGVMVVLFFGG